MELVDDSMELRSSTFLKKWQRFPEFSENAIIEADVDSELYKKKKKPIKPMNFECNETNKYLIRRTGYLNVYEANLKEIVKDLELHLNKSWWKRKKYHKQLTKFYIDFVKYEDDTKLTTYLTINR